MTVHYHPSFDKDLRKLHHQTAQYILNQIVPKIIDDPFMGISLSGQFQLLRKVSFSDQGVSYRLIYQFDHKKESIYVYIVSSRGDVYQKLSRRID
jgi:mRNA-degrading endonuclease RelE of RelBE toxin-antitoxin system